MLSADCPTQHVMYPTVFLKISRYVSVFLKIESRSVILLAGMVFVSVKTCVGITTSRPPGSSRTIDVSTKGVFQQRYLVHELVFACSPSAAAPPDQPYYLDPSGMVCHSRSGPVRAVFLPVIRTRRQEPGCIGTEWGSERSSALRPWHRQDGHGSLKVFTDSDWAGDLETRVDKRSHHHDRQTLVEDVEHEPKFTCVEFMQSRVLRCCRRSVESAWNADGSKRGWH